MLKILRLRNFQKHGKLTVKFDPHITTIVGPSDQGKSAIIRALHWLTFNRPAGEAFRRHGSSEVAVQLTTDKCTVTRRKGKGTNTYSLDKKKLKAFGSDPPELISDALRLYSFNFQMQHDSPFWLTLSAGEVTKRLNSIVNLSVIDESVQRAKSTVRSLEAEERVVSSRVQQLESRVTRDSWVEDAHSNIAETRKLSGLISRESVRAAALADVLRQIEGIKPLVVTLSGSAGAFNEVAAVRSALHELTSTRDGLAALLHDISAVSTRRRIASDSLATKQAALAKLMKGKCPLCQRKMP